MPTLINLDTSLGQIVLELDEVAAPISTANFLSYVDSGHYDGTIFHRVIENFMIQGGGFTAKMDQKPTGKPIKNEWRNGLKNKKYTVAMARLGDRKPNPSTVDSATCQFFINVQDNDFLDREQQDGGAYAVFGKVIKGTEVVDQVKSVATGSYGGMDDVPRKPVVINKATRA
jgi:cyclophilin family peptidyl-prolyl cis-trans isomerase